MYITTTITSFRNFHNGHTALWVMKQCVFIEHQHFYGIFLKERVIVFLGK